MCSFGLWEPESIWPKQRAPVPEQIAAELGILRAEIASFCYSQWLQEKKKIAEEMQFLLQIQMQRAGGQKGEQNQDQEITMLYCLKESEMKSLHLTSVVKYQRQHMGNVLSLTWAHYLGTISSLPCPKFPSFSSGSGLSTFSLSFVRSAISPSVLSQTDYLDFCSFESKITAFSYYP